MSFAKLYTTRYFFFLVDENDAKFSTSALEFTMLSDDKWRSHFDCTFILLSFSGVIHKFGETITSAPRLFMCSKNFTLFELLTYI